MIHRVDLLNAESNAIDVLVSSKSLRRLTKVCTVKSAYAIQLVPRVLRKIQIGSSDSPNWLVDGLSASISSMKHLQMVR